ncbi:MAG: 30S ribosomal protein S12 methylthiotransferase RimO [Chthonomonadales bacterium]
MTSASKIEMITLGCAKNRVDAEEVLGALEERGCRIAGAAKSDVVVINTCGFIEAAKQESVDVILEVLERKKQGRVGKVVVAGCLAQRYAQELARELPAVDAFIGTGGPQAVADAVADVLEGRDRLIRVLPQPVHTWSSSLRRVLTTTPWTAYLKISEGCNHPCTFCAIPAIRGPHVSKPLERVVAEAEYLARRGVKELVLVGQDTTQYGYDLAGRTLLPDLLKALAQVDGVEWIRLLYCYPSRMQQPLIEALASTPKVCAYVDMPLQHAAEDILRAMRRPMNSQAYLRIINDLRQCLPDVALRSTFIVGFPGETPQHFRELESFLQAARFDHVGVFEYSREEGTPAASFTGGVAVRIKRARKDRLMRLQQHVSLQQNQRWIGRRLRVLVEQVVEGSQGRIAVGRSFRDAPEVDGRVLIRNSRAKPGEFVWAHITGAQPYDLTAQEVASAGTPADGRVETTPLPAHAPGEDYRVHCNQT